MSAATTNATTAIVACQFCDTLNRVALDRLEDGPKCAECAKPLLLDRPVKGKDEHLSKVISGATVPVLVDFYADWCGPCRMMAPVLDELARERAGQLLVVKVNSDQNPVSPQHFGVRGIPTLVLFRDGQEVNRQVGFAPKAQIERMIDASAR
ncbi:MAG: thioredoxin TrxC [Gemmatimonadetes bacterium]|nr:thioredoxin TrxC [Gemmatimonadota bacterium]